MGIPPEADKQTHRSFTTISTPLSHIGETGLIERLQQLVEFPADTSVAKSNLIKGISDDAAVYLPSEHCVQLVTTDAFVEGVHFDLTYTSLRHLGWKAMVANLSDIAAMGGEPRYAVISLALPAKISAEMVEQLYEGIASACKAYSCLLVGGDTVASLANMFLSITLTGEAKKEKVVYRSGAKDGDVVCVTGHLGASQAGLKILQREKARYAQSEQPEQFQPNLSPYTPVLEKHLMPKPRLDIAQLLRENISVHSMIDISDGLASELHRISHASGVGFRIEEKNIPLSDNTRQVAQELSENPVDYALFGGEDYELLFTLDESEWERLRSLSNDVVCIGKVVKLEDGIELVKANGETVGVPFGGWEHFRG